VDSAFVKTKKPKWLNPKNNSNLGFFVIKNKSDCSQWRGEVKGKEDVGGERNKQENFRIL
jgi:hypothetical protein